MPVVYKITDNIKGYEYIGVDKHNNPRYLGSGVRIKRLIADRIDACMEFPYGLTKTILYETDDHADAYNKEAELVDHDYISKSHVLNIALGGQSTQLIDKVIVKDSEGNIFTVLKDDERYLNGELVGYSKNKTVFIDTITGKKIQADVNDPRVLSGELVGHTHNYSTYRDKNGSSVYTHIDDPRVLSGELVGYTKGLTVYKDKDGNIFHTSNDDPRVLSGELISVNDGKLTVRDKHGNTLMISKDDPRVLSGEFVHHFTGRKRINKDGKNKFVLPNEIDKYLSDGWALGKAKK